MVVELLENNPNWGSNQASLVGPPSGKAPFRQKGTKRHTIDDASCGCLGDVQGQGQREERNEIGTLNHSKTWKQDGRVYNGSRGNTLSNQLVTGYSRDDYRAPNGKKGACRTRRGKRR